MIRPGKIKNQGKAVYYSLITLFAIVSTYINAYQATYLDDWVEATIPLRLAPFGEPNTIGYAGRYFGNIVSWWLNQQGELVDALVKTAIVLAIVLLATRLILIVQRGSLKDYRSKLILFITFMACFFSINVASLLQIWNWNSGISRYLTPFVLLLWALNLVYSKNKLNSFGLSVVKMVDIFFLAVLSQLNLENFTTSATLLGVGLLIVSFFKKSHFSSLYRFRFGALLIGQIFGAAAMFLSNRRLEASKNSEYHLQLTGILQRFGGLLRWFYQAQRTFIILFLLLFVFTVIFLIREKKIKRSTLGIALFLGALALLSFLQMAVVSSAQLERTSVVLIMTSIITLLYLVNLVQVEKFQKLYAGVVIVLLFFVSLWPVKFYQDSVARGKRELTNIENVKQGKTEVLEYPLSKYRSYYYAKGAGPLAGQNWHIVYIEANHLTFQNPVKYTNDY
ncbi:MAG: DUF6056 family protein [Streptococcaceae bacterium]|jgi:hypothetical protein|nr:DUF6056 family protein [Streptococcaceae bacterium]